ncbi:DUF3426 domain-containing protein [Serpentinimonas barnesii]|uniref:DUF3426 domain-containing protein n=1 Tax=Serpentinimonas barnesii TaxID=1458427 RepID=UPI0004974F2D|nr:DUF3426 domain-containing protein [Serpentinimonas barnesii]
MSFITRCPACATTFKVVSDQLKISDGWVRCGQCGQIFDANLDLQPWVPGLDPVAAPRSASQRAQADPQQASSEPAAGREEASAPPMAALQPDTLPDAHVTETLAPEPVRPEPPLPEPALPEPPPAPPLHDPEPSSASEGPQGSALPPLPSFVRKAQRQAFWRRPATRLLLLVTVTVLALLLGLQAVYQWRAPIAREIPAAQPVLESLCQTFDCQQTLPASPNDVVIDSSVLLRLGPGLYGFQLVLRNQSALEVASPAIELTLTDIHDQVLVRRVLLPHEWPRPTATLAAGAEWSLQFELAFEGIEGRVMTGYRAILFYP